MIQQKRGLWPLPLHNEKNPHKSFHFSISGFADCNSILHVFVVVLFTNESFKCCSI
ncbi:hypothetical protein DSECCO2_597320 [anaerobic digester metagenome]